MVFQFYPYFGAECDIESDYAEKDAKDCPNRPPGAVRSGIRNAKDSLFLYISH
jgi:hypothetical protein